MESKDTTNSITKRAYKDNNLFLTSNPEAMMGLDNQFVLRFIICRTGQITIHHKGNDIVLHPNEMMFLPPNNDNDAVTIKKDEGYTGGAFACKSRLMKQAFQFNTTMRNITIYLHTHPVIYWKMSDTLINTIRDLFIYAANESEALFREDMIRSLFLFILYAIMDKIADKADDADVGLLNRGEILYMKFLGLLNQHFKEQREVAYYANELHLSPKYLSAICKEQSGKSASVWINEAVVEEIRYQLLHSDLSVKEICVMMNFPNISFFGRYVKKHLGYSPQAYRKLIRIPNED